MATDTKIAMITVSALLLLSSMPSVSPSSPAVLSRAITKDAPSSSNTRETVVEVGIPMLLNMSSTTTSVTITARNIVITSVRL